MSGSEDSASITGPPIIVLLGPPGGGKGTQAKRLVSEFGFEHFSVGDALRGEVKMGTGLGKRVQEIMASGELVSDEIVGEIITNKLGTLTSGLILDGYPRNVKQARFLASISATFPVYVVNIDVDEGQVVRRLSGRRFCSECGKLYNVFFSPSREPGICDDCGAQLMRRPDDHENVIEERLKVYRDQTLPVVEFYRSEGNYYEVDGNWDAADVFDELCRVVGALVS